MIVADKPHKIEWLRLLYLKRGLYLEINTGMKSRGGSAYQALKEELGIKMNKGGQPTAYSAIKKQFNLKGNRQRVWDDFKIMIEQHKILYEDMETIKQQQGEA